MALYKQQFMQFLPVTVSVILLAYLAMQLANLTLTIFFTTETEGVIASSNTANIVQAPQSKKNPVIEYAASISQKHLLGKSDIVKAEVVETVDAPETKLDLVLRGILATGDKDGLAIIAKGRQEEKMYRIDDKLPDNATLKAVYADRVLIEGSRGLETLRIELDKNRLTNISSSTSNNNRTPGQNNAASGNANKLAELRKEIIRNPLSFTQKISIKPQKDTGGKLIGYELNPSQDEALFSELGLQSGDVATSINGLDLTDTKNARRAMNILRRSKKINMVVLRNGRPIQIEQQL